MRVIDLNADVGEADNPGWAKAEAQILTAVTSANIACGGHAGTDETMRATIRTAKDNGVTIGAHPAYPDRDNFGRASLILGQHISAQALRNALTQQISRLAEIAAEESVFISYVKPHGALYNDAVKDREKAELIAEVIADIDSKLILLGGPNSEMTSAAKQMNIGFVAEGFIDRRYTDDGHLLSRTKTGAILATDPERIQQALSLVLDKTVQTNSGQTLTLDTQSLCLHGDSQGAVKTAKLARDTLEAKGVKFKAFIDTLNNKRPTAYVA